MSGVAPIQEKADRIAAARAALVAAETRTGARRAELRGVAGGRLDIEPLTMSLITTERPPLPVPPELASVLPEGLRRGAVTTVLGSTSVLLAIVAQACVEGTWVAVVGHQDLGLLAAARAGIPLSRLGLIPDPGARSGEVLAALIDGMGVVVVGPNVALSAAETRRLTSRVRERGATLVSTVPWPGAHTVVHIGPVRWSGLGAGDGQVRRGHAAIERPGRPVIDVVLPLPTPTEPRTVEGPYEVNSPMVRAG